MLGRILVLQRRDGQQESSLSESDGPDDQVLLAVWQRYHITRVQIARQD
jgi:hypothetical protein